MDFKSLDHEVRTLALVGGFLQRWAMLEYRINSAIGEALGLDKLQAVIVARNVQFTAKIHILNTAVWHSEKTQMPFAKRKNYQQILNAIQSYSPIRNMMAHDLFMSSQTGNGVEFAVIKARGRVQMPDEEWSIEKFEEEYARLTGWQAQVDSLIRDLKGITLNSMLAEALLSLAGTTSESYEVGALGPAPLQPQSSPDSSPPEATHEIAGESSLDAPGTKPDGL